MDRVLNRKVPAMVFIQNQKLLQQQLEQNKSPKVIKKLAQKNLDRYQDLENDVAISRVEGIAFEYLNRKQISKQFVESVVTYSSGDSKLEDDEDIGERTISYTETDSRSDAQEVLLLTEKQKARRSKNRHSQ